MTSKTTKYTMLPYRKQGEIDYASLDFNPDVTEPPEDSMEQNNELDEIMSLLRVRLTDFGRRPDIFLNRETNICYDPTNLNVRVAPDVYVVFGVEALEIPPRRVYLPWEAGKPPDWVLEIASASTARVDLKRKPAIYAQIGVPEYWRFDPSGGNYYDSPLYGGRLVDGGYEALPLTTEPDGVLKCYSPVLELSLCWDEGWPRVYDPATGTYVPNWRQEREALLAAEAENERLREELRRLRGE